MKTLRLFSSVAAIAALAVLAAPFAEAQCVPSRLIESIGNGMGGYAQVGLSTDNVSPLGDEIGQVWDSANSNFSNNFSGTCPASTFWGLSNMWGYGLEGELSGPGCSMTPGCTGSEVTIVVEDWDTNGPPGVGGTAYFVAWRVNETPAQTRWYDFARTNFSGGNVTFNFTEFPQAFVTGSTRNGMNVEVTLDYADVAPNFHGATGADGGPGTGGQPIPPEGTILSYDLMMNTGLTDPGRDRSLWTMIDSVPYDGAGVPGVFQSVSCVDMVNDAWIAVGMTFSGGAGPNVESQLVGRATQIECDPNLADPQQPDRRDLQKVDRRAQPLRSGGAGR